MRQQKCKKSILAYEMSCCVDAIVLVALTAADIYRSIDQRHGEKAILAG